MRHGCSKRVEGQVLGALSGEERMMSADIAMELLVVSLTAGEEYLESMAFTHREVEEFKLCDDAGLLFSIKEVVVKVL